MAATTSDAQLFEEHFRVDSLAEPAKYDRVDRVFCTSLDGATSMSLDVNNELFPCRPGDALNVALATTLALDGSKDDDQKGWRDVAKTGAADVTLADSYEYVCYGKVYKFDDGKDGQTIKVYTSFGGLLMALEGSYKKLTPLRVEYVYLLVRRT